MIGLANASANKYINRKREKEKLIKQQREERSRRQPQPHRVFGKRNSNTNSSSTLEGSVHVRKTSNSSSFQGSTTHFCCVEEASTQSIRPPEEITIATTPYSSIKGETDDYSITSLWTTAKPPAPFFELLLNSEAYEEIQDAVDAFEHHKNLVKSITNIPEFKVYYTFLKSCLALGQVITLDRAKELIHQALQRLTKQCTTEDSFVAFELLLRKCGSDHFLTEEQQIRLNNRAEVKRMEHADFVIDMKRVIESNSAKIEGLDGTIEQIKHNMVILDYNITQVKSTTTQIQEGLRFKMKMEAGITMVRACLNAASFGMAGGLADVLTLVFNKVVDFGDIAHLRTILSSNISNNSKWNGRELVAHLEQGVELGHQVLKGTASAADDHEHLVDEFEGEIADRKLAHALKEGHPLLAIGFVATMVRKQEKSLPIHLLPGEKTPFQMWSDAIFCDDDEDQALQLHAAVKYSDEDLLNELLFTSEPMYDKRGKEERLNQVDSKGRTALDLAALTGQVKLMHILEKQQATKYQYASSAKMRAIAKKRSAKVEDYKEYIMDVVDC